MKQRPTEGFLEYVLGQFDSRLSVAPRGMFGGHGLYSDGGFFGIVHKGRLYFKTDDATRPAYEAEGMACFQPTPEQALKNYYEVPTHVQEDGPLLTDWAIRAVAVNLSSPSKSRE